MAVVNLSGKKLEKEIRKFSTYLLVQRALRPLTRELYSRIVSRILREVGTTRPNKQQVTAYIMGLHERKTSSTNIRNNQLAIENYMAFCGQKIEFKRPKKKARLIRDVLSEAEVAVLIAAAENLRERAIISLLACTGIRNRELCGLRVCDIDMPHNLIRVEDGKGGSAAVCHIPGDCIAVVMQYLQAHPRNPDDYLFTTLREGVAYTPWALRRLVKKLASKAGIQKRVFPHEFRHSLASNLLRRGANPITVQWQLRHRHLTTTLIYIHSGLGNSQREVAHFAPAYL